MPAIRLIFPRRISQRKLELGGWGCPRGKDKAADVRDVADQQHGRWELPHGIDEDTGAQGELAQGHLTSAK